LLIEAVSELHTVAWQAVLDALWTPARPGRTIGGVPLPRRPVQTPKMSLAPPEG